MRRYAWHVVVGLALGLAAAVWHTGFHVVPADGGAWRGVSDPPQAARWALCLAGGALLALALARRPAGERRPLAWLWLAAAPLLPVLTGWLPLALLFQGPMLVVVALAALGVCLSRAHRSGSWLAPSPLLLFAAAFLFYAALGTRLPGRAGPQGDEPHYLVMAQSLASDGDLDLTDEFEGREYASFFRGVLQPHTSPASPHGELYSIHAPGLPVLILPAYLLGGYAGVKWFLSMLAALAGVLVFRLVHGVCGRLDLAWVAWATLSFVPPLPFFAVAVYPETVAILATAIFLVLARRGPSLAGPALGGLVAAALPWLHPKLLPLALVGAVLVVFRQRSWWLRVGAPAMLLLSVGLLLLYFQATYGQASLSAAYGPGFSSDVQLLRIPRGTAGLLLDRQFGLLSVAPIWALALPGLAALLREQRGEGLRALLLGGATFGVGASFSMWWGGACPPARFVVPCLPALALGLAMVLSRRREWAAALWGVSFAVVAFAAQAPRAIHNRNDGRSGLLGFMVPGLDLDEALPSFLFDDPRAPLLALSLLAAMALAWQAGTRGLLVGTLAYGLLASGLRERPLVDPRNATLRLLAVWDETSLLPRLPQSDLGGLSLPLDLRRPPWLLEPGESLRSRRIDLPPGRYRFEVVGHGSDAPDGSALGRIDLVAERLQLGRQHLRQGRPETWSWELVLPTGARRLLVEGRGLAGQLHIDEVQVSPEVLVPRSARSAFSWPRVPLADCYRVGSGSTRVRVTTLDDCLPDGDGFRLQSDSGRFVVEVAGPGPVEIRVERPQPALGDTLYWGPRRIDLGGAARRVSWPLDPSEGRAFGRGWLVPVRLGSRGARISFAARQAPATLR